MYTSILEKIGLNSTEANVYEALVSLAQATPAEIAKRAEITRVNAYQILPRLEMLGLVQRVADSKKMEYIITTPDRLLELLDEQIMQVTDAKVQMRKALRLLEPKLNLLHEQPVVKYFYGTEGVKGAYMDFLEHTQEKRLYGMLHRSDDPAFVKWLDEVFIAERVKRKIKLDMVVTDLESGRDLIARNKSELRTSKLIESDAFPEGTYILIGNARVMMVTKQTDEVDSIGIIIEHGGITKAVKAAFDLLWD